ncbi:MAG TPA: hypothetical protein VEI74_15195, partial [Candidatus Methylomirabilis sp.]|nr:hypothetical protein [Candidatus Methylomirabilis sp.]
ASEILIESGKLPEFTRRDINRKQPAQNDDREPQNADNDIRESIHGSPHPTFLFRASYWRKLINHERQSSRLIVASFAPPEALRYTLRAMYR